MSLSEIDTTNVGAAVKCTTILDEMWNEARCWCGSDPIFCEECESGQIKNFASSISFCDLSCRQTSRINIDHSEICKFECCCSHWQYGICIRKSLDKFSGAHSSTYHKSCMRWKISGRRKKEIRAHWEILLLSTENVLFFFCSAKAHNTKTFVPKTINQFCEIFISVTHGSQTHRTNSLIRPFPCYYFSIYFLRRSKFALTSIQVSSRSCLAEHKEQRARKKSDGLG